MLFIYCVCSADIDIEQTVGYSSLKNIISFNLSIQELPVVFCLVLRPPEVQRLPANYNYKIII